MLILIIAINTGCGPGKNITPTSNVNKVVESAVNSSNSDYAITKAKYADKEIKISYPQITKLGDIANNDFSKKLQKDETEFYFSINF